MSHRTEYPHGVPSWVTVITPDPEPATAFYADLFGWTVSPTDGYFTAQRDGRDVAAIAPVPQGVTDAAWITQVTVDSADATVERARAAGGTILAEPFTLATVGRQAVFADPAGAVVNVKEPGSLMGAQVVNEPGAWAMSRLATPEPDAAVAFYGEVFGWTTKTFGPATMFCVPGYVGGEPEQPVSRETVAVMVPEPSGPAAWVPDFWIDDLDTALTKVGAVHVGPMDNPPFRTAIVSDPAGATFSLSQFKGFD